METKEKNSKKVIDLENYYCKGLPLRLTKASDVGDCNFIYLPNKKLFFYADFVEFDNDKVVFIHETADEHNDFVVETIKFKKDEMILVLSKFNVTPEMVSQV